ncbi:hypothetical protein D3C78_617520 [compost metagenome]
MAVRGRPRGLGAAALVDGHVDQHRAGLHLPHHAGADQLGRRRAGDQHAADHQIGRQHQLAQRRAGRVAGGDAVAVLRIQAAQGLHVLVEDGHLGAEADGHRRGMTADHAAADDHHLARRHPRHAAEQHAPSATGLLQTMGADLDRHAPGHLRHRRQQRQAPAGVGDRLVGDAAGAAGQQLVGLRPIRGQVQVGEQGVLRAQVDALGGQRLLDLDDQLRLGEHLRGVGSDPRTGLLVVGVAEADGRPGLGLHPQLMAERAQLGHRLRGQADAVFVVLDFPGDTDTHGRAPSLRFYPVVSVASAPPPARRSAFDAGPPAAA